MKSIFLSHSSKDKAFVRKIYNDLVTLDVVAWFDEAEIKPGDSLLDKIGEGIKDMDILGVVISVNSINSEWVNRELKIGIMKSITDRAPVVIPILIDDVSMPTFLADVAYADFRPSQDYKASLGLLLRALAYTKSTKVLKLNKPPIEPVIQTISGHGCHSHPNISAGVLKQSRLTCQIPYEENIWKILFPFRLWWQSRGETRICLTERGLYAKKGNQRIYSAYANLSNLNISSYKYPVTVNAGEGYITEYRDGIRLGEEGLEFEIPSNTTHSFLNALELLKLLSYNT